MKTMTAVACRFRRGDHDYGQPWESGIAIGTSDKGMHGGLDANVECIIDGEGQAISSLWDYRLEPAYGCFIRPLE